MSILPELIYRLNVIPIRIPTVFVEIDTLILKHIWKVKRIRIVKMVLRNKNKIGRFTLPDFQTSYKATILQDKCGIS